MSDATPVRDEGLERLEAFSSLLTSTRERLTGLTAALQTGSESLEDGGSAAVARLRAFNEGLLSWTEALGAAQQAASAELAALVQAAVNLTEQRIGEGRSRLEAEEKEFSSAAAEAHETLARGAAELAGDFARVEAGVDELEGQLGELDEDGQEALNELHARLAGAGALIGQAVSEAQALLDQADAYVAGGLTPFLDGAFRALRDHLATEAQPYLATALDQLAAALLRCFDDLQSALEAIGEEIIQSTAAELASAAQLNAQLTRDHRSRVSRAEEEAVQPLAAEASRCGAAMAEGAQVAASLATLAPLLHSARDVAHQVDEMMNVLNPFD